MRVSLTLLYTSIMATCFGRATKHKKKVLRSVKTDGKILQMKTPVKVEEVLKSFSCSGIGGSEKAQELLPLDHQLKLGEAEAEAGGVKRIKVVITKKQLQQLLEKQLSVEEVLLTVGKSSSSCRRSASWEVDSPTSSYWKPKLEAIPEGSE